jgi:ubiquitin C-terminal hydrolase
MNPVENDAVVLTGDEQAVCSQEPPRSHQDVLPIKQGLINLGGKSCFLNAALQMFYSIETVVAKLLGHSRNLCQKANEKNGNVIISET